MLITFQYGNKQDKMLSGRNPKLFLFIDFLRLCHCRVFLIEVRSIEFDNIKKMLFIKNDCKNLIC